MTAVPINQVEDIAWPDIPIPCESFVEETCDNQAEWILWRACCMQELKYTLQCTEHKDEMTTSEETVLCQFCKSAYTPARRIVMHVEPLNARPEG